MGKDWTLWTNIPVGNELRKLRVAVTRQELNRVGRHDVYVLRQIDVEGGVKNFGEGSGVFSTRIGSGGRQEQAMTEDQASRSEQAQSKSNDESEAAGCIQARVPHGRWAGGGEGLQFS